MPHYFREYYDCDAKGCEEQRVIEYSQGATFMVNPLPQNWTEVSDGHPQFFCGMHKVTVAVIGIHEHIWNNQSETVEGRIPHNHRNSEYHDACPGCLDPRGGMWLYGAKYKDDSQA